MPSSKRRDLDNQDIEVNSPTPLECLPSGSKRRGRQHSEQGEEPVRKKVCSDDKKEAKERKKSDVFNMYLERLSIAIDDPESLALSFRTQKIIKANEQREITDVETTQTAKQRTFSMLNLVSEKLESNPEMFHTVIKVLYNHVETHDIASEIARNAGLGDPSGWQQTDPMQVTDVPDVEPESVEMPRDKEKENLDYEDIKVSLLSPQKSLPSDSKTIRRRHSAEGEEPVTSKMSSDDEKAAQEYHIDELEKTIEDTKMTISETDKEITHLKQPLEDARKPSFPEDTKLDEHIKERDQYISKLNRTIYASKEKISEQAALIQEKDALIDSLSRAATQDACVQASYLDYLGLSGESLLAAEVLAETVFEVSGDEHQSLSWPHHGFRLTVPAGAVPPGATISLVVKSILSGEFELPESCELVSTIYWIKASQPFNKAVILHLHHCAVIESEAQCSHYKFVTGRRSQTSVPYTLKIREGGVFTPHWREASIWVKQFCFYSIVTTSPRDSEMFYMGQAFYHPVQGIYAWEFDFLITRNDPSLVEEVKRKYVGQRWTKHHQQELQFQKCEDKSQMAITLCIAPPSHSWDKWELKPINPVKIRKCKVDGVSKKSEPPYCGLSIKWRGDPQTLPDVSRVVKLEGAKEDEDYFSIQLPAQHPTRGAIGDDDDDDEKDGRSSKHPKGATKEPSRSGEEFESKAFLGPLSNPPTLFDFLENVVTRIPEGKWRNLGIALGIPPSILDGFKPLNPQERYEAVFQEWEKRCVPGRWQSILEALRTKLVGEGHLADMLSKRLCTS